MARTPPARAHPPLAVPDSGGNGVPRAQAAGSRMRALGPGSKMGPVGVALAPARLGALKSPPPSGRSVRDSEAPVPGEDTPARDSQARRAARAPRTHAPERPPRAGTRAPALGSGLSAHSVLEVRIGQCCPRRRAGDFTADSPGYPQSHRQNGRIRPT